MKITLERSMQIAQDTKKEFVYLKTTGKWYWHDRGAEFDPVTQEEFDTFEECLSDAVLPYTDSGYEDDVNRYTKIRVFDDGFGWQIDASDDQGNYSDLCWTHWNGQPIESKEMAISIVADFCKELGRDDLANCVTVV